jgi:hypothetical protein
MAWASDSSEAVFGRAEAKTDRTQVARKVAEGSGFGIGENASLIFENQMAGVDATVEERLEGADVASKTRGCITRASLEYCPIVKEGILDAGSLVLGHDKGCLG